MIVLQLKNQIESMIGIPTSDQRLLCGGTNLSDYKAISEYNITENTILYMVVSLHGG
jgi:hypothetical protein